MLNKVTDYYRNGKLQQLGRSARGAFETTGVGTWSTPGTGGLLGEDKQHIHSFRWNDVGSFDELLNRFSGDTAGVIVRPYHHPLFRDSELPRNEFLETI